MPPTPKQVKAALGELKQVARKEPRPAIEGCLGVLERLGPAGGEFDEVLTSIAQWLPTPMRKAKPAPAELEGWLTRLWQAWNANPERLAALGSQFGKLCGSPAVASRWADSIRTEIDSDWQPSRLITPYLATLLSAERYDELLSVIEQAPGLGWQQRVLGVGALSAQGHPEQAIAYAERAAGLSSSTEQASGDAQLRGGEPSRAELARTCEAILIAAGQREAAYARYALVAGETSTYVAWFRAVRKRYPERTPESILADLVAHTVRESGEATAGKWFAAAKDAELYDQAIQLVSRAPADPRTLVRAARDYAEAQPSFAMGAGLAALRWMLEAHHYEITNTEVWGAYNATLIAAEAAGQRAHAYEQIRQLISPEEVRDRMVTRVLSRELGLS